MAYEFYLDRLKRSRRIVMRTIEASIMEQQSARLQEVKIVNSQEL